MRAVTMIFLILAMLSVHGTDAELQRFEHPTKADGSLTALVIGDWGRKGQYNQSEVAYQANGVDLYINGHDHCLQHISSSD
ncbi:UNVERIFIED_CONTAM: Purple acid phosphatase 8, partial [Sesamum latifolium]